MLKKLFLTILGVTLPLLAVADELTLKKDAPKSYVVKKGDTLWDISGVFLKQPWLWPKLWRINPEVSNPHLIYPGDELRLVFDEQGKPMILRGKPELKWSPQNRVTLKDQSPVSVLPLNAVAQYIRYDSILTEEQFGDHPYIIGSDRGEKSSLDGFNAYVNGDLVVGKTYAVYQKAEQIIDSETDESLGYHLNLLGSGRAIRSGDAANKEPATLYLETVRKELRSGSIVLPVNEGQLFPSYFTMQAANKDARGAIVGSSKGLREFGKLEVVMINLGKTDQIKLGDVLSVARTSPGVVETSSGPKYSEDASAWYTLMKDSDYKMPEEPLGQVMVFRVYDDVSMALILKSTKPLRLQDIVVAP